MKKVRAAAVVAVATSAVQRVREYAREHPSETSEALDKVEDFIRGRTPQHADKIGKGSGVVRQGLGLPPRATPPAGSRSAAVEGSGAPAGDPDPEDPDPDTAEPWSPHAVDDPSPLAPNPAPGTSDDPQPRRGSADAAPMTPGERLP